MKKSNILMTGAAALVALMAVVGVGLYTFAQTDGAGTTDQPWFGRGMMRQNLTDEQKAELEVTREERQAAMDANREKIESAITEGYDAWAAAVKAVQGENAPILSQVNTGNFDRFAEAHGYMEKARAIFEELGINEGKGFGAVRGKMGPGGPGGFGHAGCLNSGADTGATNPASGSDTQ